MKITLLEIIKCDDYNWTNFASEKIKNNVIQILERKYGVSKNQLKANDIFKNAVRSLQRKIQSSKKCHHKLTFATFIDTINPKWRPANIVLFDSDLQYPVKTASNPQLPPNRQVKYTITFFLRIFFLF